MFEWNQFGLQDALSPVMEEFILFHDYLMLVLMFIITGVAYFMISLSFISFTQRSLVEGQLLEAVWTILPALILIMIAVPSLMILYSLDNSFSSDLTLKVLGHQWYWSYEYTDFWVMSESERLAFDSYMIPSNELEESMFRLLETDNRPVLPYLSSVRVLVSSADVLHSWALPSLGVKLDATPGRLNQVSLLSHRPGVVYGQCSEICGANHSFMPIALEFMSVEDFLGWVELMMD